MASDIKPVQSTTVLTLAMESDFTTMNSESGTRTQGDSIEEALANLQEATEPYYEEFLILRVSRIYGCPIFNAILPL